MSSSVNSLQELFVEEVQDLYDAEKQLLEALPKRADAATNPDLKQGFTGHLEQTKNQVSRLEQVFDSLAAPAEAKTGKVMKEFVAEGSEAIELDAPDAIRDACPIGAARRGGHSAIGADSAAIAFADKLGNTGAADLLQQTLEEEEDTDESLSAAAEGVNDEALAAGSAAQ